MTDTFSTIISNRHSAPCRRLIEAGDAADDNLLMNALDGVIALRDAIATAARSVLEDECAASRLRGRLDEMEAQLRTIERRAEGQRKRALQAMTEAGLDYLEAPGLRIDVRMAPPTLLVSDEGLIPDAFKVERPSWLDYQANALKAGEQVPGAALSPPEPYLSVRTT